MTIPAGIIQKLGDDYDYGKLAGALQAGLFDSNPEVKKQAEAVIQAHALKQSASAKFASDETRVTPAQEDPNGFNVGKEALTNAAGMALVLTNPASAAMQAFGPKSEVGVFQRAGDIVRQFTHDATMGIVKAPQQEDPRAQVMFDMMVKPLTSIGAMIAQGALVTGALGYVGGLPKAAVVLEKIPQRLREIGVGATVMGTIDALRAEGAPKETSMMDPSGSIAKMLVDQGVPERLALGIGGSLVGASFSQAVFGVAAGLQMKNTMRASRMISDADLPKIREALAASGVQLETNASKYKVAEALIKHLSKVTQNEKMGSLTADLLTRQKYIANAVLVGDGARLGSDDAKVLAGVFRNNPGGVSMVEGITDVQALDDLIGKITGSNRPKFASVENINATDRKATYTLPNGDVAFVQYRVEGNTLHVGFMGSTGGKGSVDAFTKSIGRDLMDRTGATLVTGERISGARVANAKPGVEVKPKQLTLTRAQLGEDSPTLGMNVQVVRVQRGMTPPIEGEVSKTIYDVLIARPDYVYSGSKEASKEVAKASEVMSKLGAQLKKDIRAPGTTIGYLLHDGEAIRGGFSLEEVAGKLKLQVPAGATVEESLHRTGGFIKMEMDGGSGAPTMKLTLSSSITQEQFNALGRSADALKFGEVTLVAADGAEVVLKNPLGTQLQDAVASIIKPQSTRNPFTPELIKQFQKTGVFKGQAALLNDGTPVEIVHKSGALYTVKDPLLGKEIRVHPSKLNIMPTTLTNEFQPSNLFMDALSDAERASFAKVRQALSEGLGQPITKFRELRSFANARGFYAEKMKGGKVQLESALDGETLEFANVQAAIEHIRKANGPMPELTPEQMQRWLGGNRNLGPLGSHGQPPNFGEMIPPPAEILFADLEAQIAGKSPGAFGAGITPTRGLFLDLDRKSGGTTQLYRHFENLQSATVAKHNFIASWYDGTVPGIEKGIMPLKKIMKLAGKDAQAEKITHWLEVAKGTPEHAALEAGMTTNEIKAAQELRKWYDAMFKHFGVEADYLQNYAPRWRESKGRFGALPSDIWTGMGNDPRQLPKGAQFFADHYRDGTIDIYDTDAFRVATSYLRAGSANRFTTAAWNEAKQYAILLNSSTETRAFAKPFADYLLATKGMEFSYQRKMISETLSNVFEMLPGEGRIAGDKVDALTNFLLGMTYSSVMGARPALALRNSFQVMITTWPIIGGGREGIFEAMGRALTVEGKAAAIADRAIDVKGMVIAHQEQAMGALGSTLGKLNEAGMYHYTSADHFTRATSYWAGRLRAEKALAEFAEKARVGNLTEEAATKLRRTLLKDSGMYIQDEQVQAEFMRRAASDPMSAAGFAGKQLSDVTNFMYGRGMQARWMRSVPGRLLGQFGSWSMWYVDYLRRSTAAMVRNGYKAEAAAFLARNAIINGAVIAVGHRVLDVDLNRWAGYGAVFYSGGPALSAVGAVSQIMRGAGSIATFSEDPLAQSRVNEGVQMLEQMVPNAIPFYYGARDAIRLVTADEPAERLAAALSTQTTRAYRMNKALDIITGNDQRPFVSSEPHLEDLLNAQATGQRVVTIGEVNNILSSASPPANGAPGSPSVGTAGQQAGHTALQSLPQVKGKQPSQLPNEVVKPAESKPIQQY